MSENFESSQSFKEAYLLAARYCSSAERCMHDVRAKFMQWQVTQKHKDALLKKLQDEHFVDEQRYANAFVKDKFYLNAWGRIKIQHYLRQKAIPDSIIQQSIVEIIHEEEYLQKLNALIKKKALLVKAKDSFAKKAKLMQFAQSRGFESYLASKAVDHILID